MALFSYSGPYGPDKEVVFMAEKAKGITPKKSVFESEFENVLGQHARFIDDAVSAAGQTFLIMDDEQRQRFGDGRHAPQMERALKREFVKNDSGVFVPDQATLALVARCGIIELAPEFTAPEGGFVVKVLVFMRWQQPWGEMIDINTPQTDVDGDIRKVGEQSLAPTKAEATIEEYILPYFGKVVNTTVEKAQKWMVVQEPEQLEWAHSRAPTTIIGATGNLLTQLKKFGFHGNSVAVFSGQECLVDRKRYVRGAWQSENGYRKSCLLREWSSYYYLPVFSRKHK